MFIPRIYQNISLQENANIVLNREATNHLIRVLRLKINDQFIVFNGTGGEFTAIINKLNKNEAIATIKQFSPKQVESPLKLHLGQGISRGEKMDYTIQKAVELGVQQISPLITARCGVKLSSERWDKKMQHWRAVAIAACEQCGRNQLPEIFEPMPLFNWLKAVQADLKFICHPAVDTSLKSYKNSINSAVLLIGSESGLEEREFEFAIQSEFNPLRLGSRVLRTETAAVAAITALQVHFGDMG